MSNNVSKLNYTAQEINEKLAQIDVGTTVSSAINNLKNSTSADLHVASLAIIMNTNDTRQTVTCRPFPIAENGSVKTVKAYNIGAAKLNRGDICLLVFTDRDF